MAKAFDIEAATFEELREKIDEILDEVEARLADDEDYDYDDEEEVEDEDEDDWDDEDDK